MLTDKPNWLWHILTLLIVFWTKDSVY